MISISVDIDQAATQRLERLFLRFEREMPERIAGATRRAGIYVLNSLKARTIKAPKKMRSSEYSLKAIKGGYVTRMPDVIHHWEFVHLPGTTDAKRKVYGAYATRERSKATKWKWRGLKAAEERREIVNARDLLKIRRAGLAKLSWGWIAKQVLGSTASVVSWHRMRGERRDPRNFVKGLFRRIVGKGAEVELMNALDYILDALPPGAIGEALTAASNRLEHNLDHDIERKVAAA